MNFVDKRREQGQPMGPLVAEDVEFISPLLNDALRYWTSIKGQAALPSRADMEPEKVVSLWPHILMVDVMGDGDYFVRLFGQNLVKAYGEQTGRRVSESSVPEVVRERSKLLFDFCVERAAPAYAYWQEAPEGKHVIVDVEALCLPLSSNGRTPDRLMSLNVNTRREKPARRY